MLKLIRLMLAFLQLSFASYADGRDSCGCKIVESNSGETIIFQVESSMASHYFYALVVPDDLYISSLKELTSILEKREAIPLRSVTGSRPRQYISPDTGNKLYVIATPVKFNQLDFSFRIVPDMQDVQASDRLSTGKKKTKGGTPWMRTLPKLLINQPMPSETEIQLCYASW